MSPSSTGNGISFCKGTPKYSTRHRCDEGSDILGYSRGSFSRFLQSGPIWNASVAYKLHRRPQGVTALPMSSKVDSEAPAAFTWSDEPLPTTPRMFERVTSEQEVEFLVAPQDAPLSPESSVEFVMPARRSPFTYFPAAHSFSSDGVLRAAPPTYAAALTPDGYVFESDIEAHEYVCTDHELRTGRLFDCVPAGPLSPTLISANADGTGTRFYCVTVGLKVGVITDALVLFLRHTLTPYSHIFRNEATACVEGVTGGLRIRKRSQRVALNFFNSELAKGNVVVRQLGHSRS